MRWRLSQKKAVRTQVENQSAVHSLRAVFGAAPLTWLRPQHVYQYADKTQSNAGRGKPRDRRGLPRIHHGGDVGLHGPPPVQGRGAT